MKEDQAWRSTGNKFEIGKKKAESKFGTRRRACLLSLE